MLRSDKGAGTRGPWLGRAGQGGIGLDWINTHAAFVDARLAVMTGDVVELVVSGARVMRHRLGNKVSRGIPTRFVDGDG